MVRMFQETIDVNRICTMSNDTLLPRYLLFTVWSRAVGNTHAGACTMYIEPPPLW